jgi:hypothetical protein
MREVGGLIKDLPYTGLFLMVGTFALLGFPPFGSFLGELLILSELAASEQMLVFTGFCRGDGHHLHRHRPLGVPDDLGREHGSRRPGAGQPLCCRTCPSSCSWSRW